jgi:ribonuclease D
VLKAVAADANIAPTLLATTGDLQTLIDLKPDRSEADLPILRGWRRRLAGDLLLEVLAGKIKVWISSETGKIKFGRPLS